MSTMASSRKSSLLKLDLDPERYVISDDMMSYTSFSSVQTYIKFACLRYGNNQEIIFNTESQNIYLLDFFFKVCQDSGFDLDRRGLDVVDVNGELKNIRKPEVQNEYASEILRPGKVYILVDVEQGVPEVEGFPKVKLLLKNSDLLTPKLNARIANASDPKSKDKPVGIKKNTIKLTKKKTPNSSRKSSLTS